uniref:Glutaredoxin domain-containing protein n=1 Tax=Oryza punctata TaxID=4537 RepID=A0A0E0KZI6_ORYPU
MCALLLLLYIPLLLHPSSLPADPDADHLAGESNHHQHSRSLMQGGGGVSCAVAGEAAATTTTTRGGGMMLGLTLFDPPGGEQPAERIGRLVRESPVVIFARRGCCMCHVMRRLLAAVGAHATVIELDEAAEEAAASAAAAAAVPALFVGGAPVGGLDGLMGLHLSGRLVPRLRELLIHLLLCSNSPVARLLLHLPSATREDFMDEDAIGNETKPKLAPASLQRSTFAGGGEPVIAPRRPRVCGFRVDPNSAAPRDLDPWTSKVALACLMKTYGVANFKKMSQPISAFTVWLDNYPLQSRSDIGSPVVQLVASTNNGSDREAYCRLSLEIKDKKLYYLK